MPLFRFRPGASPWEELRELRERMDEILGSAIGGAPGRVAEWTPPTNVEEREDEIVVTAELPGMRRENIEIELENNVLTIRGEKRDEFEEKAPERLVRERRYGRFVRSFTLPHAVDAERVRARFEAGVLTIVMPKRERTGGRRIDVEE